MKSIFNSLFILFIIIFQYSYGQQNHLDIRIKEKQTKKEKKKNNKILNRKTINYDATSLWDAIRPALGANIFFRDGKAIINTGALFASGNNFILWVVNGVIVGEEIPNNINIYEIEKVEILRNPIETGKYGFRGSSGVIEITLKN